MIVLIDIGQVDYRYIDYRNIGGRNCVVIEVMIRNMVNRNRMK